MTLFVGLLVVVGGAVAGSLFANKFLNKPIEETPVVLEEEFKVPADITARYPTLPPRD